MFKKIANFTIIVFSIFVAAERANAGVDLSGFVQRVQIAADGRLWFVIDNAQVTNYCQPDWFGFNMYIPADHPQFSYYYGILMTALIKNKGVLVANISKFNGTIPCDITVTGFGLTILG